MDLTNKVFFITGGAQGLGKGFSQAVLDRGGKVFFGDVDAITGEKTLHEFQEKYGQSCVGFGKVDVTDSTVFRAALKQATTQFGHVDVFVNNAGIMHEGIWEKMVQINVVGTLSGTKIATEYMRKDKGGRGGRIINISSIAGLKNLSSTPVYCATKHAVRSFTCSMALQSSLESQGIEYGVLCPGGVATDLVKKLDNDRVLSWDTAQSHLEDQLMSRYSRRCFS